MTKEKTSKVSMGLGNEIPIASKFLSPMQVNELREKVAEVYGTPEVVWAANPDLDRLLNRPLSDSQG